MAFEYSSEIRRLLKLGSIGEELPFSGIPEGLPIVLEPVRESHPVEAQLRAQAEEVALESVYDKNFNALKNNAGRFKGLLIYPIIFIGAFMFFYIVLNFSSLTSQFQGMFTKPQAVQILGNDLQQYYSWINGYYYSVNDAKLLDPNTDIDKDGLTNHDEFILRTNPTLADSSGNGISDGVKVLDRMNLWGVGIMPESQKKLVEQLDLNVVSNRIAFYVSEAHGSVLGAAKFNYDITKPGTLSIPKLNLQVPLIWSTDPANFDADLTQGVIHYPGTAMPGERGTIYVSGHSSDYLWKKDPMQSIFARLNYLKPGDDVFIDIYGVDGKIYNYRYQVTGSNTYKPDDQAQFIDDSVNKLNLSTCWPIGTSKDRLVVSAVQIGL